MRHDNDRQTDGKGGSTLYDDITSRIIAELEESRVPWVRPWATSGPAGALGPPYNAATGRPKRMATSASRVDSRPMCP